MTTSHTPQLQVPPTQTPAEAGRLPDSMRIGPPVRSLPEPPRMHTTPAPVVVPVVNEPGPPPLHLPTTPPEDLPEVFDSSQALAQLAEHGFLSEKLNDFLLGSRESADKKALQPQAIAKEIKDSVKTLAEALQQFMTQQQGPPPGSAGASALTVSSAPAPAPVSAPAPAPAPAPTASPPTHATSSSITATRVNPSSQTTPLLQARTPAPVATETIWQHFKIDERRLRDTQPGNNSFDYPTKDLKLMIGKVNHWLTAQGRSQDARRAPNSANKVQLSGILLDLLEANEHHFLQSASTSSTPAAFSTPLIFQTPHPGTTAHTGLTPYMSQLRPPSASSSATPTGQLSPPSSPVQRQLQFGMGVRQWQPLGRNYYIHAAKLAKGTFSLSRRTPADTMVKVAGFRNRTVSKAFREALTELAQSRRIPDLSDLSDPERKLLIDLAALVSDAQAPLALTETQQQRIDASRQAQRQAATQRTDISRLKPRLMVLIGQVKAGNTNNPQIQKEGKTILQKLQRYGKITADEASQLQSMLR